jgi:hypothetical protein
LAAVSRSYIIRRFPLRSRTVLEDNVHSVKAKTVGVMVLDYGNEGVLETMVTLMACRTSPLWLSILEQHMTHEPPTWIPSPVREMCGGVVGVIGLLVPMVLVDCRGGLEIALTGAEVGPLSLFDAIFGIWGSGADGGGAGGPRPTTGMPKSSSGRAERGIGRILRLAARELVRFTMKGGAVD